MSSYRERKDNGIATSEMREISPTSNHTLRTQTRSFSLESFSLEALHAQPTIAIGQSLIMGNLSFLRVFTSLALECIICLVIWRYYNRYQFRDLDKYETFWPRFWTGFVDSTVLWPLTFITHLTLSAKLPIFIVLSVRVFTHLAWIAYTILLHARSGQTVGKWVTKVRVVDFKTEQQISLRQACIRESVPLAIGAIISTCNIYRVVTSRDRTVAFNMPWILMNSIPALWFLAEIITMLTNKKRRALHDLIAGTVVVRTNLTEIARVSDGSSDHSSSVGPTCL